MDFQVLVGTAGVSRETERGQELSRCDCPAADSVRGGAKVLARPTSAPLSSLQLCGEGPGFCWEQTFIECLLSAKPARAPETQGSQALSRGARVAGYSPRPCHCPAPTKWTPARPPSLRAPAGTLILGATLCPRKSTDFGEQSSVSSPAVSVLCELRRVTSPLWNGAPWSILEKADEGVWVGGRVGQAPSPATL